MFGDIGHGLVLLSFGLFLIYFYDNKISALNNLKYLFLFMGIFSVFCGCIYNEFFSVPLIFFESCYKPQSFRRKDNCVYPIGFDWIWEISENETTFTNSFKMKFSIIVGVIHMLLGIFIKGLNAIHFRSRIDLFFEAFPQFLFMIVTFGYMVYCIILKWLTNWDNTNPVSILQIFINFTSVEDALFLTAEKQTIIQLAFIVIAFISVILMLFPKPYLLNKNHKKKGSIIKPEDISEDGDEMILSRDESGLEQKSEQHDLSELFVHQLIETIEFVLGSVSNTASYLRLWALSLAHTQLAKVFLDMIIGWAFKESNNFMISTIGIILGFIFYTFITIGIILIMDTMECFLHALRLHWVEFQNKFYKGDGLEFIPFKNVGN